MYKVDATNKSLGRVASVVASYLNGKAEVDFAPNKKTHVAGVEISNASLMKINPKKSEVKNYAKFTGYPGGFKYESLKEIVDKKGYNEILKIAIKGMLPKNKLQTDLMKKIKFID